MPDPIFSAKVRFAIDDFSSKHNLADDWEITVPNSTANHRAEIHVKMPDGWNGRFTVLDGRDVKQQVTDFLKAEYRRWLSRRS
jgi:hypothetical protein